MFTATQCFFKTYNHYILFYEFVNSVVKFIKHRGIALFNCVYNAVVKMVFQNHLGNGLQRADHGRKLHQNV